MNEPLIISERRTALGLTPEQLAANVGLGLQQYLCLEAEPESSLAVLSLEQAKRLAVRLGVSVRQLLGLTCSYCFETPKSAKWIGVERVYMFRMARTGLGLSRDEVARRAGLDGPAAISAVEDSLPSLREKNTVDVTLRIAAVLDLPPHLAIGPAIGANEIIRQRREALGLSEAEFAARAGVEENEDLEAFPTEFIHVTELGEGRRMARVLGVELSALLDLGSCNGCPQMACHPEWSALSRNELLRARRESLGLSPRELAEHLHLRDERDIASWEESADALESFRLGDLVSVAAGLLIPFPLLLVEETGHGGTDREAIG